MIAAPPRSNLPEYTVSELARALKRSIEENFAYVRVRGEISGFKRHASGHCYLSLKDAEAVIDAVCWRPAYIDAKPSVSMPKFYAIFAPLGRLAKPFSSWYVHGNDLGRAMLQATVENLRHRVIENREIRLIAARAAF